MCRGNLRRIAAAGMLAACLLLVVPQAAEARVPQPAGHDQVASQVQPQRAALWEQLWAALGSTWAKVSVLIDPFG